jgi:dsRNA-specific ribonuclease
MKQDFACNKSSLGKARSRMAILCMSVCRIGTTCASTQPKHLSITRAILVENRTLGLVCVRCGLSHHLVAGTHGVYKIVNEYSRHVACVDEANNKRRRAAAQASQRGAASAVPGSECSEGEAASVAAKKKPSSSAVDDAPKLLADLVEAVLGAVLLDCDEGGGDGLAAVWAAYRGLMRAASMDAMLWSD